MQSNVDDQILMEMCGRIAVHVGDGCSDDKLNRIRTFLHTLPITEKPKSALPLKWAATAAAASIAALAAVYIALSADSAPYPFWVGDHRAVGVVGDRISAPDDGSVPVFFDNGSIVTLHNGAEATVNDCRHESVNIALRDGKLEAVVVGNGVTEWSVEGKHFRVVVVGTMFTVAWDEENEVLDVEVTQGEVRVEKTRFADSGIKVGKGYHLRMDRHSEKPLELSTIDAFNNADTTPSADKGTGDDRPPDDIGASTPDDEAEATVIRALRPKPPLDKKRSRKLSNNFHRNKPPPAAPELHLQTEQRAPEVSEDVPSPSLWLTLYEEGDHAHAFREAERLGINRLIAKLDIEALWKLMYAARSVGRYPVAQNILLKCRERFSSSKKATLSAFYLGKISFENTNDWSSAIYWFSTYLEENPDGHLAAEAAGRVMMAYDNLGRSNEAKRRATAYLRNHPKGPFIAQARAIQGE